MEVSGEKCCRRGSTFPRAHFVCSRRRRAQRLKSFLKDSRFVRFSQSTADKDRGLHPRLTKRRRRVSLPGSQIDEKLIRLSYFSTLN